MGGAKIIRIKTLDKCRGWLHDARKRMLDWVEEEMTHDPSLASEMDQSKLDNLFAELYSVPAFATVFRSTQYIDLPASSECVMIFCKTAFRLAAAAAKLHLDFKANKHQLEQYNDAGYAAHWEQFAQLEEVCNVPELSEFYMKPPGLRRRIRNQSTKGKTCLPPLKDRTDPHP
ncbi:hypothetical protein T440DRAFT_197620 [Plenodomus tracheiphilus IPT5]|uniref:Uncharacterized protein n=1 Tax=Plenodomus tracheiphilus IPT5 TaxID=1408161 RepID=A0A6A7AWE6_9PLEO|nr:hypothetical protein T440DRAFT_197620 [Plenodomus tracheiphilus IPT5]